MKFGDASQVSLIAAEVGGTLEAAPVEAQIELFDALIDGCQEAVKGEIIDPKVCFFRFQHVSCWISVLVSAFSYVFLVTLTGTFVRLLWCSCKG